MIWTLFHQAIRVAIATAVCLPLTAQFGPSVAAAVWATVTLVACVVGTVLLGTSAVERLTWKNHAASSLVPWGVRLGGGRLMAIPLISWAVWMLIGGGVFLLTPGPGGEMLTPGEVVLRVLLGASWAIELYALGHVAVVIKGSTGGGRSLVPLAAVLAGLLASGVVLFALGLTPLAVGVSAGPLLVVGGGYGLFVLLLLAGGRGSRWN